MWPLAMLAGICLQLWSREKITVAMHPFGIHFIYARGLYAPIYFSSPEPRLELLKEIKKFHQRKGPCVFFALSVRGWNPIATLTKSGKD